MLFHFKGDYLKYKHEATGRKVYLARVTSKEYARLSKKMFSTATAAKEWAVNWAERVNVRSSGKTAIIENADNYPGRNRLFLTFE